MAATLCASKSSSTSCLPVAEFYLGGKAATPPPAGVDVRYVKHRPAASSTRACEPRRRGFTPPQPERTCGGGGDARADRELCCGGERGMAAQRLCRRGE